MQIGDIIRIKDVQKQAGLTREMINVYHFEVDTVVGLPVLNNMADQIEQWWYTIILQNLLNAQASQLKHVRLEVDNLMAFETEFVVVTPSTPVQGNITGDTQDSFTTYSLQLVREFRTTRNGRKGIPGIPSTVALNNEIAPSVVEDLLAFGEQLLNPPEVGEGGPVRFLPSLRIVRQPTPPAIIPTVINGVSDVVVRGIGSQLTRKLL